MPDISRDWLYTTPSITRVLFFPSLLLSILCTIPWLPFLSSILPTDWYISLYYYLTPAHWVLQWAAVLEHHQYYRLVTCFFVYGTFSHGVPSTILSFILIGVYSRALEEEYYKHAQGAAQYTTTVLFGMLVLLTASWSTHDRDQQVGYMALALVFFLITHYAALDPYTQLAGSTVFQRWQSPYLLLILTSILSQSCFTACVSGIMTAYLYHVVTHTLPTIYGDRVRLWPTSPPQWLVRLYERFGIGIPKFGFHRTEGTALGGT